MAEAEGQGLFFILHSAISHKTGCALLHRFFSANVAAKTSFWPISWLRDPLHDSREEYLESACLHTPMIYQAAAQMALNDCVATNIPSNADMGNLNANLSSPNSCAMGAWPLT